MLNILSVLKHLMPIENGFKKAPITAKKKKNAFGVIGARTAIHHSQKTYLSPL